MAQTGTETVRDTFSVQSYSNNDGTQSWASDWIECGDDSKPDGGDLKVDKSALQIKEDHHSIQRTVNLAGAEWAELRFDYRREDELKAKYVALQVSSNGGATWTELSRFTGLGKDSAFLPLSFDITAHAGAHTVIRFATSDDLGGEKFWVDNVTISYIPGTPPAPSVAEGVARDEFNAACYCGNDGTQPWAGSWIEYGDDGSPNNGYISVIDNVLVIKEDHKSIERALDLAGADWAVLSFGYRREDELKEKYVALQISSDDGGTWNELTRFTGYGKDSGLLPISFDITAYASGDTVVRFATSDDLGGEKFWVDNLQIAFTIAPPPPPPLSEPSDGVLRDEFNAVSYSNDDGSTSWQGDWIEGGDDNQPSGGDIRISSGSLYLKDDLNSIWRSVDLTGSSMAA